MDSLLIFFLIFTAALFIWQKQHTKKIKRWRRALALDKHDAVFCELYDTVNGFALSREARAGQDSMEYVYGEIDFESFIALLSLCKPDPETVFYDLGSGTGKAVLACAMVFDVRKSCGIELFDTLHQCALQQRQRLAAFPEYQKKSQAIIFEQGNFLDILPSDATLVFINATTYFAERWAKISLHLEQLQSGMVVVSTSKALASSQFITRQITPVRMSWGVVNAFIQQRL